MARIFLAGGSGVVGRTLIPLLLADGHTVVATTRSKAKLPALRELGATGIVADAFDAGSLTKAVVKSRADVVVHQLTDLPDGLDPAHMAEARLRNSRLREIGTANLVAAAEAAGSSRIIAQSIAFAYAPGSTPYGEDAPLDPQMTGVIALERAIIGAGPRGIVLRYGKFYGPGTGFDAPPPGGPLHVADAAEACRLAIGHGHRGAYNIAEEDGTLDCAKAWRELGWRPGPH
jgi:nucleoside-diphosphate-sugar epimerase